MNRYPTALKEKKNLTEDKKKQIRKKRRTRNFKLVLMTCVWILFSASIVFSMNNDFLPMNNDFLPKQSEKTLTFMVTEGDSLWSIGKQYCPEYMDIRKYIHEIMKLNDMQDTTLYVNETIIIPIKE
ncbi:LysM peptidoglycan-binding domain-containing protein [Filifactor alocis]